MSRRSDLPPPAPDVATARANLRAALEAVLDDPHAGVRIAVLALLVLLDRAEAERRLRIA